MATFNLSSRKRHVGVMKLDVDDEPRKADWGAIASDVRAMKINANTPIADLMGQEETVFKRLIGVVREMYDIPDEYNQLQEVVNAEFGSQRGIVPGTVGAYFGGCIANQDISPRGCSAICAGSIPLGFETENLTTHCGHPVFLTSFDANGGYVFTQMNQAEDETERAIIYVNNESIDKFEGFSSSEKQTLAARGIEKVQLMKYVRGTNQSVNLSDWLDVDQVKDRLERITLSLNGSDVSINTDDAKVKEENAGRSFGFWVIIIIFIIIIVLAITYMIKHSNSQNNNKKPNGGKSKK